MRWSLLRHKRIPWQAINQSCNTEFLILNLLGGGGAAVLLEINCVMPLVRMAYWPEDRGHVCILRSHLKDHSLPGAAGKLQVLLIASTLFDI